MRFLLTLTKLTQVRKSMTKKALRYLLPENDYSAQKSHNALYSDYTYFTYHPGRKL